MWLTEYMTKNSMSTKNAVRGNVSSAKNNKLSVESSCEHKQIRTCVPYGMASVPPVGESAVVLPLEDGELSLGIIAKSHNLAEGEVMLFSKGGASVVLKNDGRVLINGKEF